jgi:hypothetical protein
VSASRRIYLASSWRNEQQQAVVRLLRSWGHQVYDFKNPAPGSQGFNWREIDPAWMDWTPAEFRFGIEHPIAQEGFRLDMTALSECDTCVLLLPCGRSAHLELGYAVGAGVATAVLITGPCEPELMYRMVDRVCITADELRDWLAGLT